MQKGMQTSGFNFTLVVQQSRKTHLLKKHMLFHFTGFKHLSVSPRFSSVILALPPKFKKLVPGKLSPYITNNRQKRTPWEPGPWL
jgi:hypothetical protein